MVENHARDALRRSRSRVPLIILTFALVSVAWVFFRAKSFKQAAALLAAMAGAHRDAEALVPTAHMVETTTVVSALLVAHGILRDRSIEEAVGRARWWVVGIAIAALLFAVIVTQGAGNGFIYFQF